MIATRWHASALAAALVMTFAGEAAATAAPDTNGITKIADATQAVPSAAVAEADDDSANCTKSRRRLWVDGEGWIVRRVTTCR